MCVIYVAEQNVKVSSSDVYHRLYFSLRDEKTTWIKVIGNFKCPSLTSLVPPTSSLTSLVPPYPHPPSTHFLLKTRSSRPTGILVASAVIQTANSNGITIGNSQTIFGTKLKAKYVSEDDDFLALFGILEPGEPVGHPSSSSLWALNAAVASECNSRSILNLNPEHITWTFEAKRLKSNR